MKVSEPVLLSHTLHIRACQILLKDIVYVCSICLSNPIHLSLPNLRIFLADTLPLLLI